MIINGTATIVEWNTNVYIVERIESEGITMSDSPFDKSLKRAIQRNMTNKRGSLNPPNQDSSAWEAEVNAAAKEWARPMWGFTIEQGDIEVAYRKGAKETRKYTYTQDPAIQGLVDALKLIKERTGEPAGYMAANDALSAFAAERARVEGGE